MKKVALSKVTIEGFRSIINHFELEIGRPGITFIKGPNGIGKTSIIEAIVWCLYGSTLKGRSGKSVATWEHLRPTSWRGTRVILDLFVNNIPYTIARHIEYKAETEGYTGKNTLMVFKAGSLLDDLYKSDCQAAIEKLIEVNEDKFLNSIVFGQRVIRMMNSSQKDQKTFFSSLFDLNYIDEARARAWNELKLASKELENIGLQIGQYNANYEALLTSYDSYLKELERFDYQLEQDRKSIEADISECLEAMAELESAKLEALSNVKPLPDYDPSVIKALDKEIEELSEPIRTINARASNDAYNIARKEQELQKVRSTEISDSCNVCGGKLKPELRIVLSRNRDAEIERLEEGIKLLTESLNKEKETLTGYNTRLEDKKSLRSTLSTQHDHFNTVVNQNAKWTGAVSRIEGELAATGVSLTKFKGMLKKLDDRKKPEFDFAGYDIKKAEIESQIDALNGLQLEKQKAIDALSWWYKVGFSDSGLKFYIMDSMMDAFNKHLKYYSKVLGVGVQVKSDFMGARKEFYMACTIGGYEVDYSDISGGQKQRVDLILTLALHDLISSKLVVFNCLFFDEAETGLDAKGMELFFELLRTKPDKSIYLITHRLESDYTGSNIIEL